MLVTTADVYRFYLFLSLILTSLEYFIVFCLFILQEKAFIM